MGKNLLFSSPLLGGEVKGKGIKFLGEGSLKGWAILGVEDKSRTVAEPIAREVR